MPCPTTGGALPEPGPLADFLAANAPNARAVMLPGVAHMIGLEAPEVLAAHIIGFLAPQPRWS